MKYMLDTNTLIYLIKNRPASVAERVNSLNEDDTLCMSFVTYAELLKGAERSTRCTSNQRFNRCGSSTSGGAPPY